MAPGGNSEVCGRFTLTADPGTWAQHFRAVLRIQSPVPRYNIAPGQDIAVVVGGAATREIISMRWGLIPHWIRDGGTKRPLINARAETVAEKPAFRDSFFHRRCLVPADGYYEWRNTGGRKTPFRIVSPEEELFALAGIWDRWQSPGGPVVFSCAILTIPASPRLAEIHDRMPLIIGGERNYATWLDGPDVSGPRALPRTYPGTLTAYPVSAAVNSPRVDSPELIVNREG